jgi:hypothetical protein
MTTTLRIALFAGLLALTLRAGPARALDTDLILPDSAITRVEPAAAAPGDRVTVTGLHFMAGARVWLGGAEATEVEFVSEQELRVTVPQHAPGRASVEVRLPMYRSAARGWSFTYLAPQAKAGTTQ